MQSLTRIFIFIILFLPLSTFAAIGDIQNQINITNTTATNQANGISYNIKCPTGYVINSIGIWTRSGSTGSHSMALYFTSGFITASTTITSSLAWQYYSLNGMSCDEINGLEFTINTSNSYYATFVPDTATTTNFKVQRVSDNLILRHYLSLSLPLNVSSSSSSTNSMETNIILGFILFWIILIYFLMIWK